MTFMRLLLHEELHEEIKTLDLSGRSAVLNETFFVWQELS